MVGALELSRVHCRLVGFSRVASKVTCLPIKPNRVQKYLGGTHYQYTLLYPESVSGPGGSTTAGTLNLTSNDDEEAGTPQPRRTMTTRWGHPNHDDEAGTPNHDEQRR